VRLAGYAMPARKRGVPREARASMGCSTVPRHLSGERECGAMLDHVNSSGGSLIAFAMEAAVA